MKVHLIQQLWKNGSVMEDNTFLLFGGSGHAKVISDCIVANNGVVAGIFDDNADISGYEKIPFLGKYKNEMHTFPLIVAIGDNVVRKRIVGKVNKLFGAVIHPSACISPTVNIGEGTVVFHNAIIQSDCFIESHVIINSGASVDHECSLRNFVHISPRSTLCGNVRVGEGTQIGAGATVVPGVTIGDWATIGAGAVIIRDVPDYAVVVGNPGRIIRYDKVGNNKFWPFR